MNDKAWWHVYEFVLVVALLMGLVWCDARAQPAEVVIEQGWWG